MSNARRRRQTRTRRFNLPPERCPLNHNAAVHARKHPRTVPTLATEANAIVSLVRIGLSDAYTATTIAWSDNILRAHAEDTRAAPTEKHRDIRRRYATLDRLALNGYDVREEMDALATEQAALELETCGITQPEALATANRAATEFDLTSPEEKKA